MRIALPNRYADTPTPARRATTDVTGRSPPACVPPYSPRGQLP
jgi:hypothetical protein